MPTLAPVVRKPVTSWSFSRYSQYKKCPAFFAYKNLDKLAEPGNAAMERGGAIGKMAEDYVLGKLKTLPTELALFKEEFKALKAQKNKFVEENWTWTQNWAAETEWNDWNGAWLRAKIDAGYIIAEQSVAVIIDHKTGRFNLNNQAEYLEQLELYALSALVKFPDAKIASPRLWYLDAGLIYPDGSADQPELEYTQADVPKLKKVWLARVVPLFKDRQFKPKPNSGCQWCHYRKSNNGPCKY